MLKKGPDVAKVKRKVVDYRGEVVTATVYEKARIISGGADQIGMERISLVGPKYRSIADAMLLKTTVLFQFEWLIWDVQYDVMRRVYVAEGKPQRYVREVWYVKYDREEK